MDVTALRERHVRDAMAMLPEQIDRLSWDADRLRAHRDARLRAMLRVAVERSPWHRARLAGIRIKGLSCADIGELPPMTRADLIGSFDTIVTDERLTLASVNRHLEQGGEYLLGRYTAIASGGSTGERAAFVYDWTSWAQFWLSVFRSLLAARDSMPESVDRPTVVAWVAAGHPSHGSAAMARTFTHPSLVNVRLPVTTPVRDLVAGLNQAGPDFLFAYPSALLPLAHEAAAGRLRISPHVIMTSAEPLLPEARQAAESVWGVAVRNFWGLSEGGVFAAACPLGSCHLAEDIVLVEPVDTEGRPVRAGERSAKVYVTNLYNEAMPLIRYEVTDEVTVLPTPCACGAPTQCIADIEGRLDDWFTYGGVDVHPGVFRTSLGKRAAVMEYQVRQTPRGADIDVRCLHPLDLDSIRVEIAASLSSLGVEDPVVNLTAVERIGRHAATGKLKRFVPLAAGGAVAAGGVEAGCS